MFSTQKRWIYVAMPIFFFWFFGQIDKLGLSVIQTDPGFLNDLGLTGANKNALLGLLTFVFTIAYSVSNLFWGFIIDKLGARKTALIGLVAWAATMILGAISNSYEMFFISRVILGIGEGMMIPISSKFISAWFHSREVGRAQAAWLSGNYLGPALGALGLTYIAVAHSWNASFIVLALCNLVVCFPMFYFLTRETPEQHPRLSKEELNYIRATTAEVKKKESFVQDFRFWIVFVGMMVTSFLFFGISIWLPTYLIQAKHFSREAMAGITSLSWLFALCFVIICGFVSDKTNRPGLIAATLYGLCIIFLTTAYFTANPTIAGLSLGLAMGTQAGVFQLSNLLVVKYSTRETAGRAAGLIGFTNILGGFSSYIMGWMRDTSGGDFNPSIIMLIIAAAFGLIAYITTLRKEAKEVRMISNFTQAQ